MNEAIWKLDATGQAELVRSGELSGPELVELALARVEALNGTVNAVTGLRRERALHAAERTSAGPFAGVPSLVKDLLPYPGLPCSFGARLFEDLGHVPSEHVPYTRAIEASGLISIGKSTTSEFGLLGSTESAVTGVTRNPWDLTRSAGGSSGGAAAAVACGIVSLAHASDGGGSVRIPAAMCGLFGFKPSHARCVSASAAPNDYSTLTAEHCVTRSVRDSAQFLACTERRDPDAPNSAVGLVTPGMDRPLRIGVVRTTLMGDPAPSTGTDAILATARLCQDLGHHVEEVDALAGWGPAISEVFFTTAAAAMHDMEGTMSKMLGRAVGDHELEPFTWALIRWYRDLPAGAMARTQARMKEVAAAALAFQSRWDVTLSPTLGVSTPEIGFLAPDLPREEVLARTEALAGFTPVHNLAGAPGMSVPLHEMGGLPVGSHFAAMPGQDAMLLQLAYQLEEAAPWANRWPPVV